MSTHVDGVDYTPEGIEQVRTELVVVRNAALDVGHMDLAVLFSHTLALLAELKERPLVTKCPGCGTEVYR
jgi:hypothetical protein